MSQEFRLCPEDEAFVQSVFDSFENLHRPSIPEIRDHDLFTTANIETCSKLSHECFIAGYCFKRFQNDLKIMTDVDETQKEYTETPF